MRSLLGGVLIVYDDAPMCCKNCRALYSVFPFPHVSEASPSSLYTPVEKPPHGDGCRHGEAASGVCSTPCVFGDGKAHRRFEHVALAANKALSQDMKLSVVPL